jgi:hypothetical protein
MVRFRWWTFQEETNMKRTVLLVAVAAGLVAFACGGAAPTAVDPPAAVAITQDDGTVTATAGSGRTEIVRLPPLQATEWVADCGAFWVKEDFTSLVTLHLQYDKAGSLVKEMDNIRMDGHSTFYNDQVPSLSVKGGPEGIVVKVNYLDGTVTMSGLNYKVTLPGVGVIFHNGGHYTFSPATGWVRVGGPDDWWSGDTDALCRALTP